MVNSSSPTPSSLIHTTLTPLPVASDPHISRNRKCRKCLKQMTASCISCSNFICTDCSTAVHEMSLDKKQNLKLKPLSKASSFIKTQKTAEIVSNTTTKSLDKTLLNLDKISEENITIKSEESMVSIDENDIQQTSISVYQCQTCLDKKAKRSFQQTTTIIVFMSALCIILLIIGLVLWQGKPI